MPHYFVTVKRQSQLKFETIAHIGIAAHHTSIGLKGLLRHVLTF